MRIQRRIVLGMITRHQRELPLLIIGTFHLLLGSAVEGCWIQLDISLAGSQYPSGDTIGVYLLNGSQDPDLATSIQLLFDFRDAEYINDNTYRLQTGLVLPAMGELSYIAIRYRNSDCSSNWLSVFFDNVAISGNGGTGVDTLNADESNLSIFPNPSEGHV